MRRVIIFAIGVLVYGQDSITVRIGLVQSPYVLPKGLNLYSAQGCADTSTRVRTLSAGQIRNVALDAGIQFQDPATVPLMVQRYVAHTVAGRLLGVISYGSTGGSIASAAVTTYKATQTPIGNAKTWAEIATMLGVVGAGIPIAQNALKSKVDAQAASITSGVQAAMITNMEALYTVPVSECGRAVMFLGAGDPVSSAKGVLP